MVLCFFSSTPPSSVNSKGRIGAVNRSLVEKQNYPHAFKVSLANACCTEPCCCIMGAAGTPLGCTPYIMRKRVLDTHYGGISDFICCQVGAWAGLAHAFGCG